MVKLNSLNSIKRPQENRANYNFIRIKEKKVVTRAMRMQVEKKLRLFLKVLTKFSHFKNYKIIKREKMLKAKDAFETLTEEQRN